MRYIKRERERARSSERDKARERKAVKGRERRKKEREGWLPKFVSVNGAGCIEREGMGE